MKSRMLLPWRRLSALEVFFIFVSMANHQTTTKVHCFFITPSPKLPAKSHSLSFATEPQQPNNNNSDDDPPSTTPTTASQQARRADERRQQERRADVIPGKTSAVPGASDYPIDVEATQDQWMRQASAVERQVFSLTEQGLDSLKSLRLDDAIAAFDAVFTLKPQAYVWQAGIARFYQGDLDGAAAIFARCGRTYESRFGEPASEERIWRNACVLKKYYSTWSKKERKEWDETSSCLQSLLASIPETDATPELLRSERRKVVKITHDLFSSSVDRNQLDTLLSRARLLSIGGVIGPGFQPQMDKKLWKIQAWYFMGLHHDAMGQEEESKRCLKMALRLCPNANGTDIVHSLPMLHMSVRDWFDNEDVAATDITGDVRSAVIDSIVSDLERMRLDEIQDALQKRGLTSDGSKTDVQERLLKSLLTDDDLLLTT